MCTSCATHLGFHHCYSLGGATLHNPHLSPVRGTFSENRALLIHLTVTGRCYARCRGCVNAAVTLGTDTDRNRLITAAEAVPERDARAVINLARLTPEKEVVLCFYGGEPLLAVDKIAQIMELVDASDIKDRIRYMLITNGELLTRAMRFHPELMGRLWLVAVSIDGRELQHNLVRPGTDLAKIHRNLAAWQEVRPGQVLMWSTLRESQSLWDCFQEFQEAREKGWVEHLFWHWAESLEPFVDLTGYMRTYEGDLHLVMAEYTRRLAGGEVVSLIHINELILYLLTGKSRGSSACAVEQASNFDLSGGKVHACADLPPELAIGEIGPDGTLKLTAPDLQHLVIYKRHLGCYQCGVHDYCGGRCPVQAACGDFALLGQYCALIRLHVGVVQEYLAEITGYLQQHRISLQDLYDRSARLAQFTDVTP